VKKGSEITPETFETWVRTIVADELAKRAELLQDVVKQMLDRHDEELVARLNRQSAVLARI